MVSEEGRAVPVDADSSAVNGPGPRVIHLDQHPAGRGRFPEGGSASKESPTVRAMHGFQRRVVDYLAADTGVRQFVDLGSLLPAGHGLWDVARSRAADARIIYVDAWPAWSTPPARAMTRGASAVPVVAADSMRPAQLIGQLKASGLVDFDEPAAVLLLETAALRRDGVHLCEVATALYASMCPGGYLVATLDPGDTSNHANPAAAFGPFSLLEPGLADLAWWPYPDDEVAAGGTGVRAGVGRRM